MQTPTARSRIVRAFRWLLAALAVGTVLLGIGIYQVVTLSREAATLRRSIVSAGDLDLKTKVQFSAGPVLLGLARATATLIPDIPSEAHRALAGLRKASVGVYDIATGRESGPRTQILTRANRAMLDLGWHPLATVRHADQTVLVYTDAADPSGNSSTIRVCVAVCERRQLVVASAQLRPAELGNLLATFH